VTEPDVTTWATYLPAGDWVDVWSGAVLNGSAWHDIDVTGYKIPVLCRASEWEAMAETFQV
jgi:1,3-alpha-isomaltosidase